ncbi:hypothetical protein ACI6PS_05880 [Flavobacterium sp. PLA-1-15]|uniref:hypothetical protein n=1 Tax=Flavobacterium sp. PLA-1-15 TaxID=3380533 RepID=UPI003B795F63
MKVNLKNGVDKLVFGMKQDDVVALYGKADKSFKDEDDNVVLLYNAQKLRLTFYVEEDLKLGYIVGSSEDLEVLDIKVIGRSVADVKKDFASKGLTKWTEEGFDTFENSFNEENWMILQGEFGDVIKLEVGAVFNDKDEFDWKFKK